MVDNLSIALQITVIGMGLVFAAIVLLWLVMAVLVRLTGDRPEPPPDTEHARQVEADAAEERRRRAAVAAVAVLLKRNSRQGMTVFPIPPTAVVSPWQSVMRGRQLKHRGSIR